MITKALFVLGPVTLILGLLQSSTGLIVTGAWWLVLAPAFARYRAGAQAARDSGATTVPAGMALTGTALLLAAGLPALSIGLTQWRISGQVWPWLPLIVGAALTALAVITTAMYFLGSGIIAVVGEPPTVPARIVVVSSRQTGTYINEMPRIEFVLDVTPEGGDTYRVTKKATVPFTALGSIQPGGGFDAKVVGPDDPTNMEIEWSSPLEGPAPAGSVEDRLRELGALRDQGLVSAEEYESQRQRLLDSI